MTNTNFVTDSLGRSLEVKSLTAADQFDLLEAAGNKADYRQWFGLATLVFACSSIDGVPLPKPMNSADFKKNSTILKDEGINAIAKHFMDQKTTEEDVSEQIEAAKN